MKKKFVFFLIIFFIIGFNNISAKQKILTCNYFQGKNELRPTDFPEVSVMCNIYSNYSYECRAEINNGNATDKSPKYDLKNWSSNGTVAWNAKDYVKNNNKCPGYIAVYYGNSIGGIWAAETAEQADSFARSGFVGANIKIFVIESASDNKKSEEELNKAKEEIELRIKSLNEFVDNYSIENYPDLKECEKELNNFSSRIKSNINEIETRYINAYYFSEQDDIIIRFRNAVTKAENFLKNAIQELEERKSIEVKKGNCSDYTYNECVSVSDSEGNVCVRDFINKTCRKKMACSDYTTQDECPIESDYGKCKWNSTKNTCEKALKKYVCTDYLTEAQCPKIPNTDEEGNKCRWTSNGCEFNTINEGIEIDESECVGIFQGEFGDFLKQIYSLIKFAVPIVILAFAIIDFLKAIAASDPAEVKKAATKLVKRMVIGVAIFILPTLLELLLAAAGVEFGTCGIK
ncbi:MAG: hypothetical protein HFJ02_00075 [Bacilli bacterium]|nr:hypothetical protein [Bacilli bacterium]